LHGVRAFTGAPPFTNAEVMRVLMAQVNTPPPSLRAKNGQVPEALDTLVQQLLAKDPTKRIQSSGAVLVELRRFERRCLRPETVAFSVTASAPRRWEPDPSLISF